MSHITIDGQWNSLFLYYQLNPKKFD